MKNDEFVMYTYVRTHSSFDISIESSNVQSSENK
ncbi:hypothetical protein Bhyg_04824 [Pseudolycoriella hygida]|uniref:Uncharacterized protein n=1 Tax=Pseudolycoriella hygida TaxID=35572 RepID=A0A9Q0NFX3_9DIPT|nr:hypothetical protein Bhyg_04824 [Pseudolycoriella hygida]